MKILTTVFIFTMLISPGAFANLPEGIQGGNVGSCTFRVVTLPDGTIKVYIFGEGPDDTRVVTVKDGKACVSQQLKNLTPSQLASVRNQLHDIWEESQVIRSEKSEKIGMTVRDAYSALNQIEHPLAKSASQSLDFAKGAK